MPTLVLVISVFFFVFLLISGVALMLRGNSGNSAEERLEVLAGMRQPKGSASKQEPSLLTSPLDETKNFADEFFSRLGNLDRFLQQADAPLTTGKFLMLCAAFGGVGMALTFLAPIPKLLAPLGGLCCATLPLVWLSFRRKRRLKMFAKQLPEALELISRALRAGHSLASGISLVGDEMPDPIRKEFLRCYEEQNFGIPLDDALEEMTNRVPNLDLRFFATAVILQRQTGGDLAEILDKIGRLIRERFQIWGQIQALTGEGRLSGIVLLALPPCLFVAMWRLNPDYCMILFDDPMGHQMLAVAVIMQVIGAYVIKKIIDIKV